MKIIHNQTLFIFLGLINKNNDNNFKEKMCIFVKNLSPWTD